jgi:XapX domain-containing protein
MKAMLISFAVGLIVGVAYGLLRVKSPAPPLVALAGLLEMVWGEQAAERFFLKAPPSASAKNISSGNTTSDPWSGADGLKASKNRPDPAPSR